MYPSYIQQQGNNEGDKTLLYNCVCFLFKLAMVFNVSLATRSLLLLKKQKRNTASYQTLNYSP